MAIESINQILQICINCPDTKQCTNSKNHTKVVTRQYMGKLYGGSGAFKHTSINKEIYEMRKETIERCNLPDMKEKAWHARLDNPYGALKKVKAQGDGLLPCLA